MSRLRTRIGAILFAILASALLGGCYSASPTPAGEQMRQVYDVFLAGGVIVVVFVWALIAWVLLRYRRKDDTLPPQSTGWMPIQVAWTVIPLVIVLGLFGYTYAAMGVVAPGGSPSPGAEQIHVWAYRWQWRFDYPAHGVSVVGTMEHPAEMVVPVDTPLHLTIDSIDVDHSFYVPAFLYKLDAIPGRTNQFDVTIQSAGTYGAQCAEFCGVLHAAMTFTVRAVSAADYRQWLGSNGNLLLPTPRLEPPPSPAQTGATG